MSKIEQEALYFDESEYETIMDCLSMIYSGYKLKAGWEGTEYISFNEFLKANFVDDEIKKIYDIILKIEEFLEKNKDIFEQKNKKQDKKQKSKSYSNDEKIVYVNFGKNQLVLDDDKT